MTAPIRDPFRLGVELYAPKAKAIDRWLCDREECNGEPHDAWHWCDHPVVSDQHVPRCRHSRTAQRKPAGDWFVWLVLAGRGFGKTRCGAEWLADEIEAQSDTSWAVVAPTYRDARDTCVEGESGLLAAFPDGFVRNYNRSLGEIDLTNGAKVFLASDAEPERLLGKNLSGAWCDEAGIWAYPKRTWDQVLIPALRIGVRPRVAVTTTPRNVPLIRDLKGRDDGTVHVTRGSTFDNAPNLSDAALVELRRRYEGTRLGRQELYGELLEDVEGALWLRQWIDDARLTEDYLRGYAGGLVRVVVAVDPGGTVTEESDHTGIVVVGKGADGRGYVLADRSCKLSPDGWGKRAVQAYEDFGADRIVAETNNGHDMVRFVLRTVAPSVPIEEVHASRGKAIRAEPVAALYEQGRVSHLGRFDELEDELCSWTPESGDSPDRLDALVWGLTAVMLGSGAVTQERYKRNALRGTR